ncbi:MAG: hypothetical protein AAB650_00835, partial [Patescibacteria group bacterium]
MEIDATVNLKNRIMRRVYAAWFLKSVAPLLAVELILLIGVMIGVLTHISVKNILINALNSSSGIRAFIQFFISNFLVKSVQSQMLAAIYVVLITFFIRDLR